jgi:two-component system response regulator FixJ
MDTIHDKQPQPPKPVIAVVDDDPSFLRSMERLLRVAGYRVSAFASPCAFLQSLTPPLPACVVLDMHMPEMTGIEVQDRLLAGGFCVPAILVTAHDTEHTREQARRLGFSGFLLKPFDGDVLLEALDKLSAQDSSELGNASP